MTKNFVKRKKIIQKTLLKMTIDFSILFFIGIIKKSSDNFHLEPTEKELSGD